MRNLLLLLLLANVLYFVWGKFVANEEEPGVAVVNEQDLGPPLELADASVEPAPVTEAATPDADSEEDETADILAEALEAPVDEPEAESADEEAVASEPPPRTFELASSTGSRSCVSIGPFTDNTQAGGTLSDFQGQGMQGSIRTTQGEVFVGHWVQIKGIPDRSTANEMLTTLRDGGLGEAYMVQTEDEGIKISLGLFGDLSGAERTELQAKSMGLPADISPRMRDATVFYVDLGLPPGRGAGSMIEQFGEEKVLLRDAATCPRSN